MSAKLVFVRRSNEEINVFGGDVYADVDGRNVATVSRETITIEVSAGTHLVKMYKSHDFGSMIGFAENEITVSDGETLVFRYSPPMVVTQPGHITVSDFVSYDRIEADLKTAAQVMARDKQANERKIQQQEEQNKKNLWWIILLVGLPAVFWAIYEGIVLGNLWSIY